MPVLPRRLTDELCLARRRGMPLETRQGQGFYKLFSVSRDPYNITRASGLRMLVDGGDGWHLLAVPSAFEMGLA
jgi:hypothetical protein